MATLSTLSPVPPDALLGLMAAYRADPRTDKVDLGVGVYRDETGNTPIMKAVRDAEESLLSSEVTKVYESPRGNEGFTAKVGEMICGGAPSFPHAAFAAPGGCGALSLAMGLLAQVSPAPTLWVSDPTWPNHLSIAAAAGLATRPDHNTDPGAAHPDPDQILGALGAAKAGDAVLLQGPCHNPTGIDLTREGWTAISGALADRGLIPLVDIAYHGFAVSLEDDLLGVRTLVEAVPEALVTYSCSKNFGLYRERCGALFIKMSTEDARDAVASRVAGIARASYSMPPSHGPAIVEKILTTPDLEASWRAELSEMRDRMISLRQSLSDALHPRSNEYDPHVLTAHNGMFSQLPLSPDDIAALKEKGIYIPGNGRINIAGLVQGDISRVAEMLSPYL